MFNKKSPVGAAKGRPLPFLFAAIIAVHAALFPAHGQDAEVSVESAVEITVDVEVPAESAVETIADDGAETSAESAVERAVETAAGNVEVSVESVAEAAVGGVEVPVESVAEATVDNAKVPVGSAAETAVGAEVPRVVETAAAVPAAPAVSVSATSYFLSARLEYLTVAGVAGNIGLTAELGMIRANGVLLSADVSGGQYHFGLGVNAGYSFAVTEAVKCAAGGWAGYRSVALPYNLNSAETGERLWRRYGESVAYGGVFLKFELQGFELVNKLQFGSNSGLIKYDEADDYITTEDGSGLIYSIGIGYNFLNKKGGK